jgi:hypothetical protein
VSDILAERASLAVIESLLVRSGPRDVAVAVVDLASSATESLVGAAIVRGDEAEAAAKAVLDAVNRRLAPLLLSPR